MFQGSGNAPKGTFDKIIYNSGGVNNGSTGSISPIITRWFRPTLWRACSGSRPTGCESRSSTRPFSPPQGRVANEVKVNVLTALWRLAVDRHADACQHQLAQMPIISTASSAICRRQRSRTRPSSSTASTPNMRFRSFAGDIDYARPRPGSPLFRDAIPKGRRCSSRHKRAAPDPG